MKEKILLLFLTLSFNVYAQEYFAGNVSCPVIKPFLKSMPGEKNAVKISHGVPGPSPTIVIRCGAIIQPGNEPLFIIDGVVAENLEISGLNQNDIESITVLKPSIYSCRVNRGVIVITTKNAHYRTISVVDASLSIGVPSATLIVVKSSTRERSFCAADSFGKLKSNQFLNSNDSVIISSVGYETKTMLVADLIKTGYKVYLKSKQIELEGIVVESYSRRIFCGGFYGKVFRNTSSELNTNSNSTIKVYPNPVSNSSTINFTFTNLKAGLYQIRLLNSSGQFFYSFQKQIAAKNEIEQIHLNEKMSAGIYFVQVMDEKKKLVQSSKLVVQ